MVGGGIISLGSQRISWRCYAYWGSWTMGHVYTWLDCRDDGFTWCPAYDEGW